MMRIVLCIAVLYMLSSCWPTSVSLSDEGSMPPEWKTFSVRTLTLEAPNAPNRLAAVLTENIKDGIQNNTKLVVNPKLGEGELVIEGRITNYSAAPIAIQQGDEAAKNRLSITAALTIFVKKPKEDRMEMSVTQFIDYDASTTDFTKSEPDLYEEINKKIVQDVINKLLSNW